jgi:hypothetical protein
MVTRTYYAVEGRLGATWCRLGSPANVDHQSESDVRDWLFNLRRDEKETRINDYRLLRIEETTTEIE